MNAIESRPGAVIVERENNIGDCANAAFASAFMRAFLSTDPTAFGEDAGPKLVLLM